VSEKQSPPTVGQWAVIGGLPNCSVYLSAAVVRFTTVIFTDDGYCFE
jgi:hypothetical protein